MVNLAIFPLTLLLYSVPAALALALAAYAAKAYKLTSLGYLLNLQLGFIFLAASFPIAYVGLLLEGGSDFYYLSEWTRHIVYVSALGFVASAYYLKDKDLSLKSTVTFTVAVLLALAVVSVNYLAFSHPRFLPPPHMVDEYLAGLGLLPLAFIIYETSLRAGREPAASIAVKLGFGLLLVAQVWLLAWSVLGLAFLSTLFYGMVSGAVLLFAITLRGRFRSGAGEKK